MTRIFVSVNDYKPDELSWRILLYKAEFGIYLNFHAYLIMGLRKKIIILFVLRLVRSSSGLNELDSISLNDMKDYFILIGKMPKRHFILQKIKSLVGPGKSS